MSDSLHNKSESYIKYTFSKDNRFHYKLKLSIYISVFVIKFTRFPQLYQNKRLL